jgi:hypothetical protein
MNKYKIPKDEHKQGLTSRESLLLSSLARRDKKNEKNEDIRAQRAYRFRNFILTSSDKC